MNRKHDLRHPRIDGARRLLPMPKLLKQLGLGAHVNINGSAQCPLCHSANTFAPRQDSDGTWFFECSVCGTGDEITFLAKHLKISVFNAAGRYVQMAEVIDGSPKPKQAPPPAAQSGNGATSVKPVDAKRPTDNAALQGSAVALPQIELWPEAVNGAQTLNEIAETCRRYVALPLGGADALALWCAHTHLFDAFVCSPRLNISSPERGCGKTTLRDVVSLFVPRPLLTENLSVAVLFRLVHAYAPVIFADEYDAWLRDNEELRGLLNAGHRRGAKVYRCEGDRHEVRGFNAYAAAVLCGIGALPGTLHDRSIVLRVERAKKGELRARFDPRHTEKENELCRKLARWCADNRERIAACDPALPNGVFNRQADNWRPLFAIAEVAGGDWLKRCADAFEKLTRQTDAQRGSIRLELLADMQVVFRQSQIERIFSRDLVEALVAMSDGPWPEAWRGRPITERWLAQKLAGFDVQPKTLRIGAQRAKGYEKADFQNAFERYLPEPGGSIRDSVTSEGNTAYPIRDKMRMSRDEPGIVTDAKMTAIEGKSRCHAYEGGEDDVGFEL
jgi:hypothetical protein